MKAAVSPRQTAPVAGSARAEIVAILADALVILLLAKGPPGRRDARSGPVKRGHHAKDAN